MVKARDVKAVVTPVEVAKYFLGNPSFARGDRLWYKSPFRKEDHPSFIVDERCMHDFGDNTSYNIFEFVMKYKRCGFGVSVRLLADIFGISDRDYDSAELRKWLQKKREQKEEYATAIEWYVMFMWYEIAEERKLNDKCIKALSKEPFKDDAYKNCLDHKTEIDYWVYMLNYETDTFTKKEELMNKTIRGEIPLWLKSRMLRHTLALESLHIVPDLKTGYLVDL